MVEVNGSVCGLICFTIIVFLFKIGLLMLAFETAIEGSNVFKLSFVLLTDVSFLTCVTFFIKGLTTLGELIIWWVVTVDTVDTAARLVLTAVGKFVVGLALLILFSSQSTVINGGGWIEQVSMNWFSGDGGSCFMIDWGLISSCNQTSISSSSNHDCWL